MEQRRVMGNKIDSQAINPGTSPTILHYISDAGQCLAGW
jgi:hypothetical protein